MKYYLFEMRKGDMFRFEGLETVYTYDSCYLCEGETYHDYTYNGQTLTCSYDKAIVILIPKS